MLQQKSSLKKRSLLLKRDYVAFNFQLQLCNHVQYIILDYVILKGDFTKIVFNESGWQFPNAIVDTNLGKIKLSAQLSEVVFLKNNYFLLFTVFTVIPLVASGNGNRLPCAV